MFAFKKACCKHLSSHLVKGKKRTKVFQESVRDRERLRVRDSGREMIMCECGCISERESACVYLKGR